MTAVADDGETEVERLLPLLVRTELTVDDFPRAEQAQVLDVSGRRQPPSLESLLQQTEPVPPSAAVGRPKPSGATQVAPTTAGESQDPRALYRRIRDQLENKIIGRPELCRRLALAGVAHLLEVENQRILLCGATGSGKSHAATALAEVLDQPCLRIDMADVTATGWKGLDVPDVLDALAERTGQDLSGAVLVLDEVDKVRIEPGAEGNSRQAQVQLQASLLALVDGGITTSDRSAAQQFDTSRILVMATGAFGGRFTGKPPSTEELVRWGWIPELAARWGERICLPPPTRSQARELLERSGRSVRIRLGPLTKALGMEVVVPPEVVAYVVDLWFRSGADFRSASEWLVAAARSRLLDLLDGEGTTTIVLAPDDIERVSPSHRSHG